MRSRRRLFTLIVAAIVGLLLSIPKITHAAPFQPGQIFVAYGGNSIGVFADTVHLRGITVQTLSISHGSFTTGTTLSGGGGLALDESGNLYVTVQNSGIIKLKRDGSIAWAVSGSGDLDYRGIVASETLDRVFVATAGGTGQYGIHVFRASDGTKLTSEFFGGTLAFRDLAFDKHGNLYGLRHNEVKLWNARDFWGTGTTLFSIPAEDPRAIVIDEEGNIYITFEDTKVVRKYSPKGILLATYSTPTGTGSLIGLDYDPGTQRLFASHTATDGIGQILALDLKTGSWTDFGPNNLSGVRWLAVYPTPEPTTAVLVAAGLLLLKRRRRRK